MTNTEGIHMTATASLIELSAENAEFVARHCEAAEMDPDEWIDKLVSIVRRLPPELVISLKDIAELQEA